MEVNTTTYNGITNGPIPDDYFDDYDELLSSADEDCEDSLLADEVYLLVLLTLSVSLFIILTFTAKRKALCPGCCNGRGGILLSVNFLEDKTSRSMIVAAFALTTFDIIDATSSFGDIKMPKLFKVLLRLVMVGILNFLYLPLFHCISVNTFLRTCLGLFFVLLNTPLMLANATSVCGFGEMDMEDSLQQIVEYVIVSAAAVYLIYKFMYRIVAKSRRKLAKSEFAYVARDPYQLTYVKNLFAKDSGQGVVKGERNFTYRIRTFFYKNLPGFRFSISIFASISLGAFLFIITISSAIGLVIDVYSTLSQLIDINRASLNETMPNFVVEVIKSFTSQGEEDENELPEISMAEFFDTQLITVCTAFFLAAGVASIQVICTALFMLRGYRNNVISMSQRTYDDSAIAGMDNVSLVVSAIQFAGYQVAHMIWGYYLQLIVFFVFLLLFSEFIIIPILFGYWGVILYILDWFIPIFLVLFLSKFIQRMLVKKAFLMDQGHVFGLENRKCFYNMMFFMFFYNLFVGLISCVMRVIKATILGVWFFPRLDRSVFPHDLEKFDSGYRAYVCLLRLEERQNNVILLTFIQLLNECCRSPFKAITNDVDMVEQSSPAAVRRKQARNRWFLAYTLMHNESLQRMRRGARIRNPVIICPETVL